MPLKLVTLQERPVTKEVVTYVQERHPIAKQVHFPTDMSTLY